MRRANLPSTTYVGMRKWQAYQIPWAMLLECRAPAHGHINVEAVESIS